MPLQSTSGAASYDAFGGGAAAKVNYIEDCFVSWLSTGNGTSRTVTGPDMTTGGLSITKSRSAATGWHFVDTARGAGNSLSSNTTAANASESTGVTAFTATGTSIGAAGEYNTNGATYVDYLLKKQPKFFDVVTTTSQTVSHSLASVAGFVIWKRTDASEDWNVLARKSDGSYVQLNLNLTDGAFASYANASAAGITSTNITLPSFTTGGTYVVYLYAHNAGGFGLTGTDNVISCGSFTTDGSGNATIDLGYEPQWVLLKSSSNTNDWAIADNMRGWTASGGYADLNPNLSNAEDNFLSDTFLPLTATGFKGQFTSGNASKTYIYIAIRRGPMKVPTSGTSVYETITSSATAGTVLTTGFPVDLQMQAFRSTTGAHRFMDRLRGVSTNSTAGSISLASTSDAAETSTGSYSLAWNNTGFQMTTSFESTSGVFWNFRRAPSFFDEVCYTGNGGINNVQNHSLADSIGMLIIKRRDSTGNWSVFVKESGGNYSYWNSSGTGTGQGLNGTGAPTGTNYSGYNSYLTSTTFNAAQIAGSNDINANGGTYVAYLFATCAGVSKVGSYTGNGSSQTINCGFTGGARFVMVKATSTTGNWIVADSARGIVAGNDPALYLNSTAAEVTGLDWIDADNSGFVVNETATIAANTNGVSYIFFAVA